MDMGRKAPRKPADAESSSTMPGTDITSAIMGSTTSSKISTQKQD
jgi:hypothetical protein